MLSSGTGHWAVWYVVIRIFEKGVLLLVSATISSWSVHSMGPWSSIPLSESICPCLTYPSALKTEAASSSKMSSTKLQGIRHHSAVGIFMVT